MKTVEELRYIRDGLTNRLNVITKAISNLNTVIDSLTELESLDKSLMYDLTQTEVSTPGEM